MQYFQAVQEGKIRSNKAQMKLFEIAGFAMLTLTTKKKEGKFYPVGEEIFSAVIKKPEGYVVLLVDEDGYTKYLPKSFPKLDYIDRCYIVDEVGLDDPSEGEF